ncbi:GNAT family N-acetyltransferase [Terracoccus sp. 273MFTsu3.1]|uniref:GNAT family N-acetyltransferase n=1 Tax=Terracoccus sp. 273MFTsu3.1 TaxID=1172188 RepID=UPI0003694EF7|nr:GNAT family N-acetyltransferase [Terracoccus sp. 273MFTsu3.1]
MRELRPLTPDAVGDLVGACAPCTFWQTVPRNGHSDAGHPLDVLAEWVETVTAEWGPPGRIAYVDGTPAGHVVLAPARHVARLAAFPTSPQDPSTLMLVTAVTRPEYAGRGLRKALVQSAEKDALRHRTRSLEAVAARPLAVSRHACVLDVAFLEKVGFRVERDHPAYPRLRIDLRTAITLRDGAAAAIVRALDRVPGVRPVPDTHPNGSSHAHVTDRR